MCHLRPTGFENHVFLLYKKEYCIARAVARV